MTDLHSDKILILDFGAQYTQLIARRIREIGVYCEIWAWDHDPAEIAAFGARGIILSGGPESTTQPDAPAAPRQVFDSGLPILGICYGMQTLAAQLGGATEAADQREFGHAVVEVIAPDALLGGLSDHEGQPRLDVWMSHGDHVAKVPPGFVVTANTDRIPVAAMANPDKHWYGVQFHPEVTHTRQGEALLRRFVVDICGCKTLWTADNIIEDQIARVREQIGSDEVILGLSGGVDSSVVAALLIKAIGKNLVCVHVNHGLMRKGESEQVIDVFQNQMDANLVYVDATDRFLDLLADVDEPETKRKIIGGEFIRVFEEEARKVGDEVDFLAQGTIYPDILESKDGVKAHHNVGGLPEDLQFDLVEPVKLLYKDEVRVVGRELGLPENMVERQPFPGPGLGVRCLGAITRDRLETLREADAIVREEMEAANVGAWQYFAVVPDIRATGVRDGVRAYEWPAIIRAINTVDVMTAEVPELDWALLKRMTDRITHEVPGICRVCYDLTPKPVGTVEWE